jgi:hypothetical protein
MSEEHARPRARVIFVEYKTKTRRVPEEMRRDLESRYESRGVRYGRIFHMMPGDALKFAEDAERLGVGILGLEYWYTVNLEYYPGPDYSHMLDADDFVRRSIEQAKDDITNALPEDVVWVSLTLAIPISNEEDHRI